MPRAGIEIVHVGSASRDLTPEDPRGWRLGGGATYAALTTARLGLRTAAVLGVDPAASTARELDLLRDAGVDLMLLRLPEGPVFENRETPDGTGTRSAMRRACRSRSRPCPSGGWPRERGRSCRSPTRCRTPGSRSWADDAYLVVGWQGMLRELSAGRPVTRRAPRASALLRAGRPGRRQPPRRRGGHEPRHAWPASSTPARPCS